MVVRPDGSLGSLPVYLSTLKDDDKVEVLSQVGTHGHCGRPSNGASDRERKLFREFVQEHRSPTGRTQDVSGRYHGAEFYLFSKITELKTQSGREIKDPESVLELVFRKAIQGRDLRGIQKPLKAPSGSSCATWFREDFGIGCALGHTTIFPHKSDACAICSSYVIDIDSTRMSIKRHEQQTADAGSIERQVNTG
eukprot:925960-Prymnesium_polylepis.1